jgi:transcriptional regulator with XRE-family HTH domain
MLSIGDTISQLRKQHNLSQSELADKINVSRTIIGNYERNTNTPSIDVIIKLARTFGVTVDFLIGESDNSSFDMDIVERINDIQKMDKQTKEVLFNVIDTYIQNFKTKKAFSK